MKDEEKGLINSDKEGEDVTDSPHNSQSPHSIEI